MHAATVEGEVSACEELSLVIFLSTNTDVVVNGCCYVRYILEGSNGEFYRYINRYLNSWNTTKNGIL